MLVVVDIIFSAGEISLSPFFSNSFKVSLRRTSASFSFLLKISNCQLLQMCQDNYMEILITLNDIGFALISNYFLANV